MSELDKLIEKNSTECDCECGGVYPIQFADELVERIKEVTPKNPKSFNDIVRKSIEVAYAKLKEEKR